MKANHDPFPLPKRHFDWIAWRWANQAKMGKNSPILGTLPIFYKTGWWIFFLITPYEGSSWPLSLAKTPYWLNCLKLGKSGKKRQKFANFTNFAFFLKNCVMNFFYLITLYEGLSWPLSLAKTSYWWNHPKVGKSSKNRQKFANFTNFAYFLKNQVMNFFLITPYEG